MKITSSFVGTTLGDSRYLFFVLYEDYIAPQHAFIKEFDLHLERLARGLREAGAVVKPFGGDIEATRNDVLEKDWTRSELSQVQLTPSLLVISRDFVDFSPQSDPWILFNFDQRKYGGNEGLAQLDEALHNIARMANDDTLDGSDLYSLAKELAFDGPPLATIFEVKPGIFGLSFDVLAAGEALWERLRNRQHPPGSEF